MGGMVLTIRAKVGDKVSEGDEVAVIEAMKMQNGVKSPHGGVVSEIFAFEGEFIDSGDIMMVVESKEKARKKKGASR